jgi:hypothetical protein
MDAYLGHIISVLVTLGSVAVMLVRLGNKFDRRVSVLETRLKIDDENKADREKARHLETADIARTVFEVEFRRTGTNPAMQMKVGE